MVKATLLKLTCVLTAVTAGGCANGLYSKVPPSYDLTANQDKKVLIWVESPRSAGADPDAAEELTKAIYEHLVVRAKLKPENLYMVRDFGGGTGRGLLTPEAVAAREGVGLVLFVRLEAYELMPLNIRNYHAGRMLTRTILLDAQSGQPLWPDSMRGKLHDIVVELGAGDRSQTLGRLTQGTAHCIARNLYPIEKIQFKNSDERISVLEAFDMETF